MPDDDRCRPNHPDDPLQDKHAGWYSRGYLPHFDGAEVIQSVTFRLADSLPRHVLEKLSCQPTDKPELLDYERFDRLLDSCHGDCFLAQPPIARIVENALLHFDNRRYRLYAWVIMPNHVHVLLRVITGFPLEQIVHSWKSFTANRANKHLGRNGPFWYREYYDRFIRNDRHFQNALNYIHANPVMAGLVQSPEDWLFSSARLRQS